MNSRIEGGTPILKSREEVINIVKEWYDEDDIQLEEDTKAYFIDGIKDTKLEGKNDYISYWADDYEYERKIYFPENNTLEKLKEKLIYDEKIREYVNPNAVMEFIYNCIDINALSCIQHIALLYDEPILDKNGEIEDYKKTKGRRELIKSISDLTDKEVDYGAGDEYGWEIGLGQLGINWWEHSIVIINISELVKSSKEIAEDIYGDETVGFNNIFREGLISTICHEFRHTVYDINEFPYHDAVHYPDNGELEENVEKYGNDEMEKLMSNKRARKYIDKIFDISWQKEISTEDIDKDEEDIERE